MKICYTAIGGGYDLPKPFNKTEGWKYILFTNEFIPLEHHNGWTIIFVEDNTLDNTRFSRYHKHNPHKVLKEFPCDISIWVDSNLSVNADLDLIVGQLGDFEFVSLNHPYRNCTYQEAEACIIENKDLTNTIISQIQGYEKEGFPKNHGLLQTGILFRKHNKENIIKFQEQWWIEILNKSKRDQLSFNYINWKNLELIKHTMIDSQQMLFDYRLFPIQAHKNGW